MAVIKINVEGDDAVAILKAVQNEAGKTDVAITKTSSKILGLNSSFVKTLAGGLALGYTLNKLTKATYDFISAGIGANRELETFRKTQGGLNTTLKETDAHWKAFISTLSQPFYAGIIAGMKVVNNLIGEGAPDALEAFGDTMKSFGLLAVNILEYVLKAVNAIITAVRLGVNSWKWIGEKAGSLWTDLQSTMAGAGKGIGEFFGSDVIVRDMSESIKTLGEEALIASQNVKNLDDEFTTITEQFTTVNAGIEKFAMTVSKSVSKDIDYKKMYGDNYKAFMDMNKKKVKEAKKVAKKIAKGLKSSDAKELADAKKKYDKILKMQLTALAEYNEAVERMNQVTRNIGMDLANTIGGSFGEVANVAMDFYDNIMTAHSAYMGVLKAQQKLQTANSLKSIAESTAEGVSSAGPAVAKAGAQAGYPGAIAMLALLMAIGVGVAGIGGAISGNSTVSEADLAEAKGENLELSDTAMNALNMIEENGTEGLKYSKRMADSLDVLVSASDKASASIGDRLSGRDYIASNDDTLWGGTAKEMVSTGIKIHPASMADFTNSLVKGNEYLIEKVTKSSWFGLSSKESLKETNLGSADTRFIDAYTEAFMGGVEALKQASLVLGMTANDFDAFTAEWEMLEQNLNFEGMDADERTELILQSLSANLDSVAETLTPLLGYVEDFKLAGEGTGETLIRLANSFEVVQRTFRELGWDLPPVAEGGLELSQSLEKAFGSIEKFNQAMNTFIENFYTSEQQLKMKGNSWLYHA